MAGNEGGPDPSPPAHGLDPRAVTVWRINAVLQGGAMVAVMAVVAFVAQRVGLPIGMAAALPVVAAGLVAVDAVWLVPLRWRRWRYEVRAVEVDLQYGWLTVTRVLVPMPRIQHVDTRRGPLQRRFGLASVVIFTAAGAQEIPELALETAVAVRDQIGARAHLRDDV